MSDLTVRLVALTAVLLLAGLIAVATRRRDRRITVVTGGELLTHADLHGSAPGDDVQLGTRATFVQFSTPVCAGCKPAAKVLDELADAQPGLRRIDIDATVRPDLASRLGVMSTPTVVVLDPRGYVVSRLTGVPTPEQAERALTAAGLTPATRSQQEPT